LKREIEGLCDLIDLQKEGSRIMTTDETPGDILSDAPPVDLADLVAQAVLDKIEDREHLDEFLDEVIARVNQWRQEEDKKSTV